MILLKKLQLNNFLSHENTEINFSENEKALIDGASGAGKSSIFDAILWVLYGQGRADNRSLVRKGAKKGSVCLELTRRSDQELKEDTVIITRSATQTGKHTLEVSIEQPDGSRAAYPLSGVRELQGWIDKELIGASYLLFINSVAYVQGNTESFVAQTAPKRKELLLEIVKAEDYQKHYEKARQTLSGLDNDQNRASGQLHELEGRIEPLKAKIGGRGAHIQAISDNTGLVKDIEPQIKDLEAKKASMAALLQTVGVLDGVLRTAVSEKEVLERSLASKLAKIADKPRLEELMKNATPSYAVAIEETTVKLTGLRASLAAASEQEAKRNEHYAKKPVVRDRSSDMKRQEEQIDFLEKKESCPSGEKCPYHSKTLETIQYHEKEIEKLGLLTVEEAKALGEWTKIEATLPPAVDVRSLVKEIGETESHLRNLETELSRFESIKKDIAALDEVAKEIPSLELSISEKKKQIEDTQQKKEEAEKAAKIDEVNTIDNDLLSLRGKLRSFQDAITRATAALENIDKDEQELKTTEEKITALNVGIMATQEKSRKVALVKDAFGSKGIETLVIDYLLPKLEDRINDVLSKLSDFRVRLDTQKKSADGESTIEGLFITILNEMNEEMPFEAYSGGEKLKISVAISEALATLQRVGFRLFDETFIGLDENSTESFAEVLEGLQKNFSQVLCISHLLQIKELFDKKVQIVKNNSTSYVK